MLRWGLLPELRVVRQLNLNQNILRTVTETYYINFYNKVSIWLKMFRSHPKCDFCCQQTTHISHFVIWQKHWGEFRCRWEIRVYRFQLWYFFFFWKKERKKERSKQIKKSSKSTKNISLVCVCVWERDRINENTWQMCFESW